MHIVKLSNGRRLQIEERDAAISIAALDENCEVDGYICEIDASGVLTYCNSGGAGESLVHGLKETAEMAAESTDSLSVNE